MIVLIYIRNPIKFNMNCNISISGGKSPGFPLQFIPHAMRGGNDKISQVAVIPAKAGIQKSAIESSSPNLLRTYHKFHKSGGDDAKICIFIWFKKD